MQVRRIGIAAGAVAELPQRAGIAEVPEFTYETIFELKQCPEHLIIIGAGPVGLELAQAHRRLGAKVTVLEAAVPLAADDPECAAIVLDHLAREGVTIRSGVKVTRVGHTEGKIQAVIEASHGEETIEGSNLLIAAGRRANVDGLELEQAGIK